MSFLVLRFRLSRLRAPPRLLLLSRLLLILLSIRTALSFPCSSRLCRGSAPDKASAATEVPTRTASLPRVFRPRFDAFEDASKTSSPLVLFSHKIGKAATGLALFEQIFPIFYGHIHHRRRPRLRKVNWMMVVPNLMGKGLPSPVRSSIWMSERVLQARG